MEYAQRQHESMQEDLFGPNLWWVNYQIIGVESS